MDWLLERLSRMDPRLVAVVERWLRRIPRVQQEMQKGYAEVLQEIEPSLKPYRGEFPAFARLPEKGVSRQEILGELGGMKALEEQRWKDGFVSGAVYHGDEAHIDFLSRVYALYSQSNPLHADIWPSSSKFEAEIVSMTAEMLGAEAPSLTGPQEGICGTVTSGGTESILLAMKTYRDWARERRGVTRPEMVVPVTAHAAFDKAAQYFNIKIVRIPVDAACRADVAACRKAINRKTVVVVGSAPSFPHGVVDPIAELSDLARERGIGFHTDACLGGFVLPWAKKLGYPVPAFDFSLPGVTSISVDTHKYGYASKGTSVVLYRNAELRRYQYYTVADWPGGLYFSPTFAGSRPGALIAACWAALVTMGEDGYLEGTRRILETAVQIKTGIAEIPELRVMGDPLWVIAFASDTLDIYRVLDFMTQRDWSLNGLHHPPAVHICVTLRHTQPDVAGRFIADLKEAVAHVRANPATGQGMAPVYGMAATMPLKGVVNDLLKRYIDLLYKV
jgi:glutamate/tyrosine decarboxylase-like PLP-dependent enzyme